MKRAREIGAHKFEELGKRRPAKAADDVPAFDADVARILTFLGEGLNVGKLVIPGLLHGAADGEAPVFEDDAGVVDVVAVDGKFSEGRHFGVGESRGQMAGPEQLAGGPVAEGETFLEQRLAQLRNREGAERDQGR